MLSAEHESCVRVENNFSEWFSIACGVRQGCVVAPDLFNCVIDHLLFQLKTAAGPSLGIDLDNWRLTDMDYADDIALFSPSSEDLPSVLLQRSSQSWDVDQVDYDQSHDDLLFFGNYHFNEHCRITGRICSVIHTSRPYHLC